MLSASGQPDWKPILEDWPWEPLAYPHGLGARLFRRPDACSGNLPPPSPPAEEATTSEDQARKASTDDRTWNRDARNGNFAATIKAVQGKNVEPIAYSG